jgi:DNA polymerase-3 subunit epsilon
VKQQTDQEQASDWARKLLARTDVVILDTETTGLHGSAEIVQIAIIDLTGAVLLDTLVKPLRPIPMDATHIHGITDVMVDSAPTFDVLAPQLRELLSGLTCVVYNASFDERMLEQSARARELTYEVPIFAADYTCAMEMWSQYVGAWSSYHQSYTWQKLPGGDHSALGDACACLAVLRQMAGE